jgi:hypothetical protein
MTVGKPEKDGARRSRVTYLLIAIAIALAVFLALGLKYAMESGARLCPPGNPDCGRLPPSPPAAPVPR